MLIPPNISPPNTDAQDPRLGHWLTAPTPHPRVALIGFPSDEGVRRNGGRQGAKDGPTHIRPWLYKLTPPTGNPAFRELLEHTTDLGDLPISGDLETDQAQLGIVVGDLLQRNIFPVILGGGHETAFGHFLGYVQTKQTIHLLNWDAHADVRPLKNGQAHSGSPFRQALEHEAALAQTYTVAGLQLHSVAEAHLAFIGERGGAVHFAETLTPALVEAVYAAYTGPVMASFDLDAVDQAFAPGVSAPATNGLTPALWLKAAYEAGRCAHVSSADIVEYNPHVDRDAQTARLAALTVWHLLRGLAERPSFISEN